MISPERSTGWGSTFPVLVWDAVGMAKYWEGHGLRGGTGSSWDPPSPSYPVIQPNKLKS